MINGTTYKEILKNKKPNRIKLNLSILIDNLTKT